MTMTHGVHHVGLTASRLEESAAFFTGLLGWQEVRRDEAYPAIFVSDGTTLITLWGTKDVTVKEFDKNRNVGLHHIAFMVESEEMLGKRGQHPFSLRPRPSKLTKPGRNTTPATAHTFQYNAGTVFNSNGVH